MLTHVPDHLKLNMQKAIKALDPEFSFLVFGGFVFFSDEEDKTKVSLERSGGEGILFIF